MLYYVFFFFFKQKASYELRISDLSSDLYSSDLGIWSITGSSHPILPWSTRMASAAAVIALPVERVWNRVCASTGAVSPSMRGPQPRARVVLPSSTIAIDKIGRASCRERVCQYV